MLQSLRPYQQEDVEFFNGKNIGAIFNQQRTGKTPTMLGIIEAHGYTRVLIVCPTSAVYQWAGEYEDWLGVPCIPFVGTAAKRAKLLKQWTHGLVVGYDTLKIISRKKDDIVFQYGELHNILDFDIDCVVLDEAHRIRGRTTAVANAAFALSSIPDRFVLTGTPAPGRAYEIWSIMHFLQPKEFSSFWRFVEQYFTVRLQMNYSTGKPYRDIGKPTGEGVHFIRGWLDEHAINRKRKDVMPWLPAIQHTVLRLPPTPRQKKYMEELRSMFETEHVVTKGILDRLIRYRQICVDPGLLELKGNSPKTDWILQYVDDYPERSIIIFSKFTSYLERLAKQLPQSRIIVGATPVQRRKEVCLAFQFGTIKILLLNIDAAKEALTLDKAEVAIFVDKYPPVGDIEQAEDRFVATTQDKADKLHQVIDLVMHGTYEESVLQLLKERGDETAVINAFAEYERSHN